jgi:acyl-CoA synthetase (AMP-forming)/AMP-acid ligase II
MGLIGCLITPVMNGSDIWLMEPAQFVQSPVRYLRCFGSLGARLTAMPNFGLAHITRRVGPERLDGMDFSQWRAVIVGAERIDPAVLDGFARLLGPHGLSRKALLPAYGLAEATLAVTGLPLDEEPAALLVTPDSCQLGHQIEVTQSPDARPLAGCGYPLDGTTIEIIGESGDILLAGRVGEIVARGPSIADGYLPGETSQASAFGDQRLKTGDAGFLHDGQLYVLGRLGDSIKLRGRSVFAEDLEARIVSKGVPAQRVVVLLGVHRGEPTAVALIERCEAAWLPPVTAVLRGMSEGSRTLVIDAPRTTIERTSSGKPRRRVLWQRFTAGTLPGVRQEMTP